MSLILVKQTQVIPWIPDVFFSSEGQRMSGEHTKGSCETRSGERNKRKLPTQNFVRHARPDCFWKRANKEVTPDLKARAIDF